MMLNTHVCISHASENRADLTLFELMDEAVAVVM